MSSPIRITRGDNPYSREVQGKANEPITVAALLGKMLAASKDSSIKGLLRSALSMAKTSGIADALKSIFGSVIDFIGGLF